jgi:hypothetical protein
MGEGTRSLENLILVNGIILVGVAIPHLIDDFLYGIPEEFGLSNMNAQILAGIFSVILLWIFFQVGRGNQTGTLGACVLGIFLALAGTLKHVPRMLKPGPYWSGAFSESLIIALILSGLSLSGLAGYVLWVKYANQ